MKWKRTHQQTLVVPLENYATLRKWPSVRRSHKKSWNQHSEQKQWHARSHEWKLHWSERNPQHSLIGNSISCVSCDGGNASYYQTGPPGGTVRHRGEIMENSNDFWFRHAKGMVKWIEKRVNWDIGDSSEVVSKYCTKTNHDFLNKKFDWILDGCFFKNT